MIYSDAHFSSGELLIDAKSLLTSAGIEHFVMIEDVQEAIELSYSQRKDSDSFFTARNDVHFDYSKYHTLDEISEFIDTLAATYPELVSLIDVGTSFEGRTIRAVRFTGDSGDNATKAGIWLDGGIHAREWISPATTVYVLGHLLAEYGKDEETTRLIDGLEWFILPGERAKSQKHKTQTTKRKTQNANHNTQNETIRLQ